MPFADRLKLYAKIAHERMETDKFKEFCRTHLSHLDDVAVEFFSTPRAKELVRQKVEALYPAHEVERFTEHFWGLVQFWRQTEIDRLNKSRTTVTPPVAEIAATGATAAKKKPAKAKKAD